MEKNKKIKKAKIKTKIMPIKKTQKNNTKKTKKAKCCPLFSGKKKCATKLIIGLVILAIIIIGAILLIKVIKKDSDKKVDIKRPLDINNAQQAETGEVVETYLLDEEPPTEPEVLTQGRFNDVEQNLKGKALFLESDGKTYLRFEEFETINGQDLHVYLSPILNLDVEDTIDLGLLKSVSGNFNYKLEKDIDIEKYSNVIIWSNPFDAFFGYASLINKELTPEQETEMTDEEKAQQDAENNPQMPSPLPEESTEEEMTNDTESESQEEVDKNETTEEDSTESTEEVIEEESTDNENSETTEEEIDTEENTEIETENTENQ